MENRITKLFNTKKSEVLNIYFTAGFPKLEDTVTIIEGLEEAGADLVEIGMPFSDPLADGPTIQASNDVALANGMSLNKLFEQLEGIRDKVNIPIILMGYINPVLVYGVERFCKKAAEVGVDGVILPDLPSAEYNMLYKQVFEENNLSNIFLVTPQTSEKRIKEIDASANGFIYAVSTNSTTGNETKGTVGQEAYFERLKNAQLNNPVLIGFNIKDNASFSNANKYANGAIIGSAFIKMLEKSTALKEDIKSFVASVRGEKEVA